MTTQFGWFFAGAPSGACPLAEAETALERRATWGWSHSRGLPLPGLLFVNLLLRK